MSINIAAIIMVAFLSLGLASGVNNAMDRNELNNMGFGFHNLAGNSAGDTVGFWSLGDPKTGDPIYLDYGPSYQYNHWIVTPQRGQSGYYNPLVSTKHLLDIANWNMADIQAYPELYSQGYYFNDMGENYGMGIWKNGGPMAYHFYGPGNSLNGWAQTTPEQDPLANIESRYSVQSQPNLNSGNKNSNPTQNKNIYSSDCMEICEEYNIGQKERNEWRLKHGQIEWPLTDCSEKCG